MEILDKTNKFSGLKQSKTHFVGISMSSAVTNESGIAVLDKNLNILRIDKFFNLNDLQTYIKRLAPAESIIISVDLPKNIIMFNGKWRQEAKNVRSLFNMPERTKYSWTARFSDRGSDLCDSLSSLNIDVCRYYSSYTKNLLRLDPPFKSRSPAACKHLQMSIKNNLKISGFPSNLIALSGLEALIGAYVSWKIAGSEENIGYKVVGYHKNTPIISALENDEKILE